jgi:hypothetical protein
MGSCHFLQVFSDHTIFHSNIFSLIADLSCVVIKWSTILIIAMLYIAKALRRSPFLVEKTCISMVFQDLNTLHELLLGAQQYRRSQANPQHVMACHQERMYFTPQQKTGTKRSRLEDLKLESRGLLGQLMYPFQKISQIPSVRT